jgi:glycerate 2-kinase
MGNETTWQATTVRDALLRAYRASVASLSGEALVARALRGRADSLAPRPGGQRRIVGVGKAAVAMARGALSVLGEVPALIAAPEAEDVAPWVEVFVGGHPVPNDDSERAGRALLEATSVVDAADTVIFLISGGGSAIAAVPAPGLTVTDKAKATRALLRSGAPIDEVNTVRKHLSAFKGGHLGAHCRADEALSLVLSDVTSGSLDMVASGPTLPDPTTYEDCLEIVKRRDPGLPASVVSHLARGAAGAIPETPKPGDGRLERIEHEALAGPATLARAAANALSGEGLRGIPMDGPITGDVVDAAHQIADEVRAVVTPCVLAFSGEPTVRPPPGSERGGRMQHLALWLARELGGRRVVILAAGSDGRDGDSDYAGAVVDGSTYATNAESIDRALARFDSTACCARLGISIPSWRTDTNVGDLVLVAVG